MSEDPNNGPMLCTEDEYSTTSFVDEEIQVPEGK